MNELSLIQKALHDNSAIHIVKIRRNVPQEGGSLAWNNVMEVVEFFVGYKTGVYDIGRLNAELVSLIPKLKPHGKNDFKSDGSGGISFGRIWFEECIGEEPISDATIVLAKALSATLFGGRPLDAKRIERKSKSWRLIFIRLHPSIQIAKTAFEDKQREWWIPKEELERHISENRGIFTRIIKMMR